jgi:organic radical activating enzyme
MRPASLPKAARITEIFSSIQGEGPRMGERHIFIRFEACHLACVYCDESAKKGRVMTLSEILLKVKKLERTQGPHACVSLTGGEPLLDADFLKTLCRKLQRKGRLILLETNGILCSSLSKVLPVCDIIAMDLKLPSVTRQPEFLKEHRNSSERRRKKRSISRSWFRKA